MPCRNQLLHTVYVQVMHSHIASLVFTEMVTAAPAASRVSGVCGTEGPSGAQQ